MIGVGPQASRGRCPAFFLRAVARLPDTQARTSPGAAGIAASTFTRDRASLAGAVTIGGMIGGTSATQEALRPVTVSHWCGASSGD